jgi:ABC-type branched-subunit amino acid transport system permease subunit
MDYLLHILIIALIYSIFAISLNLELGYTGLYNFGHVAFFGIGALPPWFSLKWPDSFFSMNGGLQKVQWDCLVSLVQAGLG